MVAYDLRRHQDMISRCRRSPFGRVDLSTCLLLYCELFNLQMFKRVLAYFLSLLDFPVGSSLFRILFVKSFFFVNLLSMSMFRFWVVGLKWALAPLGPFWALFGEGSPSPPQTNPSRDLKKERSFLHLRTAVLPSPPRSISNSTSSPAPRSPLPHSSPSALAPASSPFPSLYLSPSSRHRARACLRSASKLCPPIQAHT